MSDFSQAIANMTPNIYQRLKASVELGKWPDGRLLTAEQKTISLQAIIAYEIQHDVPEQQRVGYIEGGTSCGGPAGKERNAVIEKDLAYKVGQ